MKMEVRAVATVCDTNYLLFFKFCQKQANQTLYKKIHRISLPITMALGACFQ
jgi:hypothetical protein